MMYPAVAAMSERHFRQPSEFRPERWLGEEGRKIHSCSLLAFGYGGRSCLGRRIAEQQLYLGLYQVGRSATAATTTIATTTTITTTTIGATAILLLLKGFYRQQLCYLLYMGYRLTLLVTSDSSVTICFCCNVTADTTSAAA